MKQLNYAKGGTGEKIAADYLTRKGFTIIEKNFRTRFGEIDLVAAKGERVHFVEVKLKVGEDFGTPEEMINFKKLKKVLAMADLFLQRNPKLSRTHPLCQVDAVCIVLGEDGTIQRINHYENISDEMV